jgi:hypothetical protein
VAVLGTLLLVVFVLITALVVAWCYFVTINQGVQHMCNIMALAAAPELLDPYRLIDVNGLPSPDQTVERAAAVRVAHCFRARNNAAIAQAERVEAADVTVQTGFVDDVTQSPCTLDPSPPQHNTVFVACARTVTGQHPVYSPLGKPVAVDIRGGACATLDNLVVGFRPETDLPAPVMPMAIDSQAWASQRTADTNGNGILEMVLRFQAASPAADPSGQELPAGANAAILFFGGSADPQAIARLPAQVTTGLFPADLPGSQAGPATAVVPWPVLANQQADQGDAGTMALLAAVTAVVGQKRVFPIFQQITTAGDGTATAQIVGFVACTVLGAELADQRLAVAVEPCFLIHHTVWTVPPNPDDPANPLRNPYIYKLRLSQ